MIINLEEFRDFPDEYRVENVLDHDLYVVSNGKNPGLCTEIRNDLISKLHTVLVAISSKLLEGISLTVTIEKSEVEISVVTADIDFTFNQLELELDFGDVFPEQEEKIRSLLIDEGEFDEDEIDGETLDEIMRCFENSDWLKHEIRKMLDFNLTWNEFWDAGLLDYFISAQEIYESRCEEWEEKNDEE